MDRDRPKRYRIEALLNSGVQPFRDLDDETLDALGRGIGRKALAVPVVITSDGILIDGHQRLKAMRARGRTYIDASDVRVAEEADASNALEHAVRLNVQRRHLTTDEKADVARRLQRERKWSQRKIADLFGVTQPAVSQWLRDDSDRPDNVVGVDGVTQPVAPKRAARPKLVPHPWDLHRGEAFAMVEKLISRLRGEWRPDRRSLTDDEWDAARTRLGDLSMIVDGVLIDLGVVFPSEDDQR